MHCSTRMSALHFLSFFSSACSSMVPCAPHFSSHAVYALRHALSHAECLLAIDGGLRGSGQNKRLPKQFLGPTIYQPKSQQVAGSDEIVMDIKYKYVVCALRSTKVLFLFIWASLNFVCRDFFSPCKEISAFCRTL